MHVRKFEAETLEQALKDIKRELGPDAIILKTISNAGIKGAFKKSKIEITAAISEKSYTKKARVDSVLDDTQRNSFYQGQAGHISNMIDRHDQTHVASHQTTPAGYGKAALNRSVRTTVEKIKGGLDDFLSLGTNETSAKSHIEEDDRHDDFEAALNNEAPVQRAAPQAAPVREEAPERLRPQAAVQAATSYDDGKVEELERKLWELTRNMERIEKKEPEGIYQLRTILRSLDVSDSAIQDIIRGAMFELSKEETGDADIVLEYALRMMMGDIKTEMPLFSSAEAADTPVVTVLISESSCGQSAMARKVGALKEGSVLVRNGEVENRPFTERVLDITVQGAQGVPEIIAQTRKALEAKKNVFIDFRNTSEEVQEVKRFVDGLRRSFDKVEVLVCLSAIHAEIYNRKIASRYQSIANGAVVSHLDLCLNFGAIYNVARDYQKMPLKFFGTGEVVPDDIESATAERILAGMFQLESQA
tara:strand:- start:761 stop:2188 length:1428 start_codon:yes stop_codon:yes gene_type:complete